MEDVKLKSNWNSFLISFMANTTNSLPLFEKIPRKKLKILYREGLISLSSFFFFYSLFVVSTSSSIMVSLGSLPSYTSHGSLSLGFLSSAPNGLLWTTTPIQTASCKGIKYPVVYNSLIFNHAMILMITLSFCIAFPHRSEISDVSFLL